MKKDTIKNLCLSKEYKVLYAIMAVPFVIYSLLAVESIATFKSNMLFSAKDSYYLYLIIFLIGLFGMIFISTPIYIKKRSIDASFWDKVNAHSVPFVVCSTLQIILFGFGSVLSPSFDISPVSVVVDCIVVSAWAYAWVLLCATTYVIAKSALWYGLGFVTINFAPIIIGQGCVGIYNANPLMTNATWNPFIFNITYLSIIIVYKPIIVFLVFGVLIGIVALAWRMRERLNLLVFTNLYKLVTIISVALSLAFLFCNFAYPISIIAVVLFVTLALAISVVFTYLTFRKNKPLPHIAAATLVVAVSSVFAFLVLPGTAQKGAYTLPSADEVANVRVFMHSLEEFDTEENLDECLELHQMLLDLFEEGYMPDQTETPYKEPECIADAWEDVTFSYTLKNGKTFHREYRDLKDPAFDEFYIAFMQSDLYADSLEKTKMKIEYVSGSKSYVLSETLVADIMETYCKELQEADRTAFYENCMTIELYAVDSSEYYHRYIYIPTSFTETRNLINKYVKLYSQSY